jgi:hypothetical protein
MSEDSTYQVPIPVQAPGSSSVDEEANAARVDYDFHSVHAKVGFHLLSIRLKVRW